MSLRSDTCTFCGQLLIQRCCSLQKHDSQSSTERDKWTTASPIPTRRGQVDELRPFSPQVSAGRTLDSGGVFGYHKLNVGCMGSMLISGLSKEPKDFMIPQKETLGFAPSPLRSFSASLKCPAHSLQDPGHPERQECGTRCAQG